VIEGKTGYLVKVSDTDAIVSAMKLFLDDPDLVPKMGAESLRYARDVFDVRGVNQLILETMGLVSEATV
jgi:glycosyltransferase involved in cell wall biosynthesis